MNLASLLEEARSASPARRIEWRDRIAAHGAPAIEALKPWLADPALAGFAIRVIERAGLAGERTLAARILRAARAGVSPAIAADITWALQQLRATPHKAKPVAPTANPTPPQEPVRASRRRPGSTTLPR
jgi:hypothetical protein